MKLNEAFPSRYVSAPDVESDTVVKIEGVRLVDIEDDGVLKPVMSFTGRKKALVVNKTNFRTIAALFGDETDGWTGKQIELFKSTTQFGADVVDCVRVRAAQDQPTPSPITSAKDDIPF